MALSRLTLISRRVVTPRGVQPASIVVSNGIIEAVEPHRPAESPEDHDVGEMVVSPGLVDSHIHVNEPGRTDWEGFETAGRAAAAGGVTTILDMPLNSTPVTTTVQALARKRDAASGKCRVDFGFWGGVVPGNQRELLGLARAGVRGFKCFLVDSGIEEFPPIDRGELRAAMKILAQIDAVLLVHAEWPESIARACLESDGDPCQYATFLASRPRNAEHEAIDAVIDAARETGARAHIVHLSSSGALDRIARARREGVRLTVETCPHYLTFESESIPDGATEFKCTPPIRERENRERLWEGLREGTIDLIASDHSPCPPSLKLLELGDFFGAWGGIASLELGLSAVWTGARERGVYLADVARWMSAETARLAGLDGRKGSIAPGHDADFVVWSPESEWQVDRQKLHQRHPISPYHGRTLAGVVERTYLRGRSIYDRGEFAGAPGGTWLERMDP